MEIIISQTYLDGLMTGISINLKPDLLTQIDAAKGTQSRSAFIVHAVYEYLNPTKADWEADRKQLTIQIEAYKSNKQRLENEVAYLRDQNSRLIDEVSQKLLTEATPKKHWWQFRRKKEG